MEKVKQRQTWRFSDIRFYKEDFESCFEIMSRMQVPKIQAEGYKYDNVDEMTHHTASKRLRNLDLLCGLDWRQEVDLSLSPSGAYMTCSDEPVCIGIAAQIAVVIKSTEIKSNPLDRSLTKGAAFCFVCGSMIAQVIYGHKEWYLLLLTSIIGAYFLLANFDAFKKKGWISMNYRSADPGFFQRNKEDFVKAAITSVISAAVGGVCVWFFKSGKP